MPTLRFAPKKFVFSETGKPGKYKSHAEESADGFCHSDLLLKSADARFDLQQTFAARNDLPKK